MKRNLLSNRGFSTLELAIVVGLFAVLIVVILPALRPKPRRTSSKIQCINNLHQIGTGYRIWSGDNNDKCPQEFFTVSTNVGWGEFAKLTNAGTYCWSNYCLMENEFGRSPRVLNCPSDDRSPVTNFNSLKNQNMSYFFGAGANDNFPLSILGGDRNLALGSTPKNDYGFSPKDGKGNDVILGTNSPVCWSLKMHSAGYAVGEGNILLGDGSVQQCSSARFRSDYQAYAVDSGNFPAGYENQSNSFRLIFP